MYEPALICWCDLCGEELNRGCDCYRMDELRICVRCLRLYAAGYFRENLEIL